MSQSKVEDEINKLQRNIEQSATKVQKLTKNLRTQKDKPKPEEPYL